MTQIHYFQRYSQRENVVTNNTLLLFNRLYSYSPKLFEIFLNDLLTEELPNLSIGIRMEQQKKFKVGRIPDGFISQSSFNIVIESKLHSDFGEEQLYAHLNSFSNEDRKIIILLSPEMTNEGFKDRVKNLISKYQASQDFKNIEAVFTTFEKIIKSFRVSITNRDYDMEDIISDYEGFCMGENILPTAKYWMRVRTAGWSLKENFEYNLYYDLKSRGFDKTDYFGLYSQKAVCAVGKIENIILADFEDDKFKYIYSEMGKKPSEDQLNRIKSVIPVALERNGYEIAINHRFFLVEKFHQTDYKKSSLYPIQKSKYFDLREVLEVNELPEDVAEIAQELSSKTW